MSGRKARALLGYPNLILACPMHGLAAELVVTSMYIATSNHLRSGSQNHPTTRHILHSPKVTLETFTRNMPFAWAFGRSLRIFSTAFRCTPCSCIITEQPLITNFISFRYLAIFKRLSRISQSNEALSASTDRSWSTMKTTVSFESDGAVNEKRTRLRRQSPVPAVRKLYRRTGSMVIEESDVNCGRFNFVSGACERHKVRSM